MKKLIDSGKVFSLLVVLVFLSSCKDWNSKPVVVDDHFGDAVRHMVKVQTLNPNSGLVVEPVLGLDGQKSEGNINVYRSGNTDLRAGKIPYRLDINQE